jgi:hypothetical protein
MQRRGSAPHTFEENIPAEKAKLEAQIAKLKPGTQMDALRKKIMQLDTAAHMSEWLSSPGFDHQSHNASLSRPSGNRTSKLPHCGTASCLMMRMALNLVVPAVFRDGIGSSHP